MADGPDFFVKCRYATEAIAAAQDHGIVKLFTLPVKDQSKIMV